MTAVDDLVARGASGVLEVSGEPSGAIYLDGGRIAFARATWVPGLAPRLHAACPALAAHGQPPPGGSGGDADDAAIAALAVRQGYLTPGALHELIGSIVADAFLVLTIPVSADSSVAAIRFTSTRTYWTEIFPRYPLEMVRAEALRRAERMAEHGLAPTTAVALRDLRAPAAVVTREQWALACQIGEASSALDLAARRGAALSDTIDSLGRLTQAGLCTPVRIPRRGPRRGLGRAPAPMYAAPVYPVEAHQAQPHQAQPHPAQPDQAQPHPAESRAGRLPARHPAQDHGLREHLARPDRSSAAGQSPPVDILRQVLSGLRKLS
jgi:hypothetical protein